MKHKRNTNLLRAERSGGRRAWEWLLTQLMHSWYQAGPQTPNQMDLQGYTTPYSGHDQARQSAWYHQGRR